MNFGTALEAMKAGYTVHRERQRGYLYHIDPLEITSPIRETMPSGVVDGWIPEQWEIMSEDWLILEADDDPLPTLTEQVITTNN